MFKTKRFSVKVLSLMLAVLFVFSACSTHRQQKKSSSAGSLSVSTAVGAIEQTAERMEQIDPENFSVAGALSVTISDEFIDLVAEADPSQDFEIVKQLGLDSVGISAGISRDGEMFSVDGAALVNDTKVVRASAVLDMDKEAVYLTVPELTSKGLEMDFDTLGLGELVESYYMLNEMLEEMEGQADIDVELLGEVIEDYVDFAVKKFPADDTSKENITAAGVTQKVEASTYVITPDKLYDVMLDMLEKVKKDKKVKKLFGQVLPLMSSLFEEEMPELSYFLSAIDPDDAEDAWDSIVVPALDELISELEDEFEYIDSDGEAIEFVIYNDGDNFAGFSFEVDGEEMYLAIANDSKGNCGMEMVIDGDTLFTFEGKNKNGVVSGEFYLDGVEITVESFDLNDLSNGILNLTVSVDMDMYDMDDVDVSIPSGSKLRLKLDMDFLSSNRIGAEIVTKKNKTLVGIVLGLSVTEGKGKINVPKNCVSDPEKWVMEAIDGADNVVSNLKKAGINKELLKQVSEYINMAKASMKQGY